MYNNGDYFYFRNNFLCFCIYVTNVCSAFTLSPIIKIQGFWYLAGLWSCETHKNTLNTAKLARNLITYLSIQHIWNLSCQLGLCSCCKLANLSWNFVTTMSNIKHLSNQCKIYQFLVKFAQKIVTKSAVFYWLVFSDVSSENSGEVSRFFLESVSENPVKFDFFSRDLLEAPKFQIVENDWSLKHFVYADWENQQVGSLIIWNSQ